MKWEELHSPPPPEEGRREGVVAVAGVVVAGVWHVSQDRLVCQVCRHIFNWNLGFASNKGDPYLPLSILYSLSLSLSL